MRVQSLVASPQVRGIPSRIYWLAYPISPPDGLMLAEKLVNDKISIFALA